MNEWIQDLDLNIYQCNKCSHLWHHTIPDQQSILEMYAHSQSLKKELKADHRNEWISSQLKFLYKLARKYLRKENITLLDYGSGFGHWAAKAKSLGFKVTAYEPSEERSNQLSKKLQIQSVSSLSSLKENKFDVINFEQVLEHVPTPLDTLTQVKDYCHDKTIIRITVPDCSLLLKDSLQWKDFPFKNQKIHLMSPYEHIQGFNKNSLTALANKAHYRQLNLYGMILNSPKMTIRSILSPTTTFLIPN